MTSYNTEQWWTEQQNPQLPDHGWWNLWKKNICDIGKVQHEGIELEIVNLCLKTVCII